MKLTGIILAGGKSSRMGQDKGLMVFNGKMLVEYAIDVLRPLCDEILISSNQTGYEQFGFPVIPDNYLDCGPLGGLEAGLKRSANEWNLVIACDTPNLHPDLFKALLSTKDDFDAVIPAHQQGMEPLAALYHKNLHGFFNEKIVEKDFKLRKIVREQYVNFLNVDNVLEIHPSLFENLNSQSDLK